MNYDHLNKIYDYWRKDILPHLVHNFNTTSFEDYLKRFAWLPSGKWIKDGEKVKINRSGFAVDPVRFVKKFKDKCVAYNAPVKPEDGIQRVIYQISPTLHLELALWIWMEYDVMQSYGSVFICYHDEKEYLDFVDELVKLRRTGNTEEKHTRAGFLGVVDIEGVKDRN